MKAHEREKLRVIKPIAKCVYPDCFNCQKDDCTRSDFSTVVEKETFNIKTRYERK